MKGVTAIFHRAMLSRRDFRQSASFLREIRPERTRIEIDAFLTAAVISYARPFSRNERDPQPLAENRLDISPESVLSAKELATHNQVILLRNKAIAHAEFATDPVRLLDAQLDGMSLHGPYFELRNQSIDIPAFLSAAERMRAECTNLMYRLKDEAARTR